MINIPNLAVIEELTTTQNRPCMTSLWASQVALGVKNLPANTGDMRGTFHPWVGKILWGRARQPTPVSLPRESPWKEEPGRLQSTGSHIVGHDWSNLACTNAWQAYSYHYTSLCTAEAFSLRSGIRQQGSLLSFLLNIALKILVRTINQK